jgi:hypothetical protein
VWVADSEALARFGERQGQEIFERLAGEELRPLSASNRLFGIARRNAP